MLAEAAAEEAAAAAALGVRRVGTMDDLRCLDEDLEDRCAARPIATLNFMIVTAILLQGWASLAMCL